MKIGLYGGSFDPIHFGHLLPVRHARDELALDRILYLPAAQPPHKRRRELAPEHARYAMLELALLHEDGMFASPYELQAGGVSYTVETLAHFRRELPAARLFLILGSDSFVQLPSWHEWRRILELAELAVLRRDGAEGAELAPELRDALAAGRAHRLASPLVDVSSTAVRQAVAAGDPAVGEMVPPLVLDYVAKYGLYRQTSGGDR